MFAPPVTIPASINHEPALAEVFPLSREPNSTLPNLLATMNPKINATRASTTNAAPNIVLTNLNLKPISESTANTKTAQLTKTARKYDQQNTVVLNPASSLAFIVISEFAPLESSEEI